jgi:hypothetical protein
MVSATSLFAGGAALSYVVLSNGLSAVIGAAGDGTLAQLTVNNYLIRHGHADCLRARLELSLIVVHANAAGVLPSYLLRKFQRFAIMLIFARASATSRGWKRRSEVPCAAGWAVEAHISRTARQARGRPNSLRNRRYFAITCWGRVRYAQRSSRSVAR